MRHRAHRARREGIEQHAALARPAHQRCGVGRASGELEDDDVGLHRGQVDDHRRTGGQRFGQHPSMPVVFGQTLAMMKRIMMMATSGLPRICDAAA